MLKIEDLPLAEPGEGEVRLKVEAIGLNRADVMFRQGQYLEDPEFPSRLGYEAAGIVDAVGPGTNDTQIGDRVSSKTLTDNSDTSFSQQRRHAAVLVRLHNTT